MDQVVPYMQADLCLCWAHFPGYMYIYSCFSSFMKTDRVLFDQTISSLYTCISHFLGTGCAPFRSFIQDRAAENTGGMEESVI